MANLDDLGKESITEMSTDDAIELLRQTRLSRRTPVKSTKKSATKKPKKAPDVSPAMAANLLKILGGGK